MKRFLEDNEVSSFPHPDTYAEDFSPVFSTRPVGSSISLTEISDQESFADVSSISLPGHYVRAVFSAFEMHGLQELYSKIYRTPPHLLIHLRSILPFHLKESS